MIDSPKRKQTDVEDKPQELVFPLTSYILKINFMQNERTKFGISKMKLKV